MNPLESRPDVRAKVYTGFWVGGLALGGTQVGFLAADVAQPTWLTVALAVYAYLGIGVGYTASRNTPSE